MCWLLQKECRGSINSPKKDGCMHLPLVALVITWLHVQMSTSSLDFKFKSTCTQPIYLFPSSQNWVREPTSELEILFLAILSTNLSFWVLFRIFIFNHFFQRICQLYFKPFFLMNLSFRNFIFNYFFNEFIILGFVLFCRILNVI